VQTCAEQPEEPAAGLWRTLGTGIRSSPLRYRPVRDLCSSSMAAIRTGKKKLAAKFARAGTEIDDASAAGWYRGRARRLEPCSPIAERLENIDEPLRVARMEADGSSSST